MRLIIVLALALGLGGCGALGPAKSEAYATFTLDVATAAATGEPVPWQLRVDEPAAPTPLAGARIAQRDTDGAFGVLKGARWSERAPELIQGAIVRRFEDAGRIRGVGRAGSALRGDFLLVSELRDFEADYSGGGAPTVRLALSAKLLDTRTNDVVAARVFSESVAARGTDLAAIVAAFNAAAARVIPALCDWTLDAGQQARSAEKSG